MQFSGLEPSAETTSPRYLYTQLLPFHLYLSLDAMTLFVISLVFLALISILYLVQVLSILSTGASSSCSSATRTSVSSAYSKIIIFLVPMLTFPSYSSRASDMIHSRNMMKRVGDNRHLWLTPTVALNHSHAAIHLDCTCTLVVELLNGAN